MYLALSIIVVGLIVTLQVLHEKREWAKMSERLHSGVGTSQRLQRSPRLGRSLESLCAARGIKPVEHATLTQTFPDDVDDNQHPHFGCVCWWFKLPNGVTLGTESTEVALMLARSGVESLAQYQERMDS